MAIHGTIEEAGLPDVLQLLSLGRKSGCLSVEDGTTHGEIYLEVGRVTYAAVANRIDRLGEILVKAGRITREQLADAAREQSRRSSKRQLGRILVDSGKIERSDLEHYVRIQVEEAVYLLFTWKRGTFSFTTDRRPPNQPLLVSLDCESLLLEGARRVDEWSLIEKKIPTFDLIFRRTKTRVTGDVAEELSDDQQRLLTLLDGQRDVNALAEATGMSEFDTGKALYGLIIAGFAQLVERRSQVRHLDFRELLAYVVREAEYADPERRRNAARHIVDCPACSERLRTIHVRRTTGTLLDAMGELPPEAPAPAPGIPPEAAPPPPPPAPAPSVTTARTVVHARAADRAPHAPPAPPAPRIERRATPSPGAAPIVPPPTAALVDLPPAVPAPPEVEVERREKDRRHASRRAGSDRRKGDRRSGSDRRHGDRRHVGDRRHLVSAAWTETHPERRSGPRRAADRRNGDGERRIGNAGRGMITPRPGGNGDRDSAPVPAPTAVPVAPAAVATPESPSLPERAPWAAETADTVVSLEGLIDDTDADAVDTFEITPLAVETGEYLLPPPAAATTAAPAAAPEPPVAEPPRAAPRTSPVTGEPPGPRKTTDLVWLQSPEEAMDQIRASRAILRGASPVAPRAPSVAQESGTAATVPERASAPPAPAEPPAATASAPRVIPVRPVQTGVDVPPPPPRRPPTRAIERVSGAVQFAIKASTLRRAGIAAGIAGIALISYLAGRSGGGGAPPEPGSVAQAPASEPPAATPRAPARQERAAQPPARTAAPPATRTPVPATRTPPVATAQRTTPPVTVTTPAVAQNPPAQQVAATPAPAPQTPPVATVAAQPAPSTPAPAPAAAPEPSRPAPTAAEPDRELAAGGWTTVSRADATTALGGTLGIIQGLPVESISQSTSGTRVRIRVTQLTDSGQRITLTETRAGAAVRAGPATLTALRVLPASEAFPYSTGTASLGNVLITARSSLSAEDLRGLLERLAEAR